MRQSNGQMMFDHRCLISWSYCPAHQVTANVNFLTTQNNDIKYIPRTLSKRKCSLYPLAHFDFGNSVRRGTATRNARSPYCSIGCCRSSRQEWRRTASRSCSSWSAQSGTNTILLFCMPQKA